VLPSDAPTTCHLECAGDPRSVVLSEASRAQQQLETPPLRVHQLSSSHPVKLDSCIRKVCRSETRRRNAIRQSHCRSPGRGRPNIRDASREVVRGASPRPVATSRAQRIEEAEFVSAGFKPAHTRVSKCSQQPIRDLESVSPECVAGVYAYGNAHRARPIPPLCG